MIDSTRNLLVEQRFCANTMPSSIQHVQML